MRTKLLLLLTVLIIAASGCATTDRPFGRYTPENRMLTRQFPNGVRLLVKQTDRIGPTSIQVWVAGGSDADPKGKEGIAHFVGRMILAGSLHDPTGKAEERIESMGGSLSANTSRDFSYFAATIPRSESAAGGWQKVEEMLFDMVAYPSFRETRMEAQREMTLLEIERSAREPEARLEENLFKTAYDACPYKNSVLGTAYTVKSFTRGDVSDYYLRTYRPSNITVVVVGGMDTGAVEAKVESTFGSMAPSDNLEPPQAGGEICQVAPRGCELQMPVKLAYAELGWHICPADEPDIYALEVLKAILGEGRGSRLYMELHERQGIAYDIKAEMFTSRGPGMMIVEARMDPDNVAQFSDGVLGQIDWLKEHRVSESELDRAINVVVASRRMDEGTAYGQAYSLGYGATVSGEMDPAGQYIEDIRDVTAEDVRRAAQKYLGDGDYTLSTVVPENK